MSVRVVRWDTGRKAEVQEEALRWGPDTRQGTCRRQLLRGGLLDSRAGMPAPGDVPYILPFPDAKWAVRVTLGEELEVAAVLPHGVKVRAFAFPGRSNAEAADHAFAAHAFRGSSESSREKLGALLEAAGNALRAEEEREPVLSMLARWDSGDATEHAPEPLASPGSLAVGDILRHAGSAHAYLVVGRDEAGWPIAARSVTVTNPPEWSVVGALGAARSEPAGIPDDTARPDATAADEFVHHRRQAKEERPLKGRHAPTAERYMPERPAIPDDTALSLLAECLDECLFPRGLSRRVRLFLERETSAEIRREWKGARRG